MANNKGKEKPAVIEEVLELDGDGNIIPNENEDRNDPKYDEYKESAHDDATNVDEIEEVADDIMQTDEERRQTAINQYQPTYDMERLMAQQKTETTIQGLQNQIASTRFDYDKRLKETANTYAQNLTTMLNNLNKRGLGRSSLVGTGSVAMGNAQNQALQQIMDEYQIKADGINSEIETATRHGAETLAQLGSSYAQQVEARMAELRQQQQTAYTELQLQIAQLQYQGYIDWLNTPARLGGGKTPKKSSGGNGGGGGNDDDGPGYDSPTDPPSSDDIIEDLGY